MWGETLISTQQSRGTLWESGVTGGENQGLLKPLTVNVKNTGASTFPVKNHQNHYKTPYFML